MVNIKISISTLKRRCIWLVVTREAIIVGAEMSQKWSWRDLFVQIELGVDIASLGME